MSGLSPARHGFEPLYFLFRLSGAVPVREETTQQTEHKKNSDSSLGKENVCLPNSFRFPSLMSGCLPRSPRAGDASVRLVYAH
jgi:hypothetical protein